MAERTRYRRKTRSEVAAVRLDLDTEGFTYRKWGGEQRCKRGDWLVYTGDETYTVDAAVFERTFREVSPGRFEKVTVVWAVLATAGGAVKTLEGSTKFRPGDYLVSNDEAGTDSYAIESAKFHELYEPVED